VETLIAAIKALIVLTLVLSLASLCTWIERKASALLQDRIGANRAGAFIAAPNLFLRPFYAVLRGLGILGVINTLFCDPVKGLFKEDFVPAGTPNFIHSLAPFMAVLPVFLAYAFIPFAPDFELGGYLIRPQVAGLDAGILFIFALGSLAVYGPAIAGWSSNNKFSLIGGLRAAAQMISYELAMGIALVSVIVSYGTLDLYAMVEAQQERWGVFVQPLAMLILFVVGMAETKRAPFDLPEAESEIVAGYFTEYSGMKFLLFWMGEFAEIALFSALIAVLFFGGWDLPFVDLPKGLWWSALIGHAVLMAKIVFFCTLQIVIRWTLPRFRYDQLMRLGWKILLPLSLANLVATAVVKLLV
jgi:NADH-quinone oxidoreductase subunit H